MENNFDNLNGQELFLAYSDYNKNYYVNLIIKVIGGKIEKRFEGNTIQDALHSAADWLIKNSEKIEMINEMSDEVFTKV